MVTCEAGVIVCHCGGVLSAGSAKLSFRNRFRLRLCSCGLCLDGKGQADGRCCSAGSGAGAARGLLFIMVDVHGLAVKKLFPNGIVICYIAQKGQVLALCTCLYERGKCVCLFMTKARRKVVGRNNIT